jgi:bacterioferritin
MNRQTLISKLNWFYSLELNQVDLYMAQSKTFRGSYESIVFERTAWIEQQHVDNIGDTIKELGGKPTKLGGLISPLIGGIAGKLVSSIGVAATLKANILIENKAMNDYTNLINQIGVEYGEELLRILEHNLVDEDVHTVWFRERLIDYDNDLKLRN